MTTPLPGDIQEVVFLGGYRRFPWALTLTLGCRRVEVPSDSLSPVVTWVFPREFKN